MNEIRLYDIANSKWYMQNATGDIPEMRNKFCAGATWADDRSSYNMYVIWDNVFILFAHYFTDTSTEVPRCHQIPPVSTMSTFSQSPASDGLNGIPSSQEPPIHTILSVAMYSEDHR